MKNEIKTIKGYLRQIQRLDRNTIYGLKGYDKLTDKEKETLNFLSGAISNDYNDLKHLLEEIK